MTVAYLPAPAQAALLDGARRGLPVMIASAPFGLLYGALAADQGLTLFETVLMSAAIYGGASQIVGLELFGQKVPPALVVLSIFAVNFRHILYSAAVGRRIARWPLVQQLAAFFFLVDPVYAETENRVERGERLSFAWYMGMCLPIYVSWLAVSGIGHVFGKLVPDPHALGFDFLVTIYFFGLVLGFRKRPLWAPIVLVSGIASVIAYKTVGSPWHVSIGALAGIIFAVLMPAKRETKG